jgi:hypothetical protein
MPSTTPPVPSDYDYDDARIIERPDGFYWQDKATGAEFGPFDTLAEAVADMASPGGDDDLEVGESLAEAETEVGIADWIDPDTGLPAEGPGPHIEDN